jgi:hypothetical protein
VPSSITVCDVIFLGIENKASRGISKKNPFFAVF